MRFLAARATATSGLDPALESRFITEDTGVRAMRSDIPISLPPAFGGEALKLRNRLLHYRFCHLFETRLAPEVALSGVEPRVNQIALPLLSLMDDPVLREQIGAAFMKEQAERFEQRQETVEAWVLGILKEIASKPGGLPVNIGTITDRFNRAYGAEFGKPV